MTTNPVNDELLIEALALGYTQKRAADFAGMSERTVRRRLLDPEFQVRLGDARDEFVEASASRLTAMESKAIDRLEAFLDDDDNPNLQFRAATKVLEVSGAMRERARVATSTRQFRDAVPMTHTTMLLQDGLDRLYGPDPLGSSDRFSCVVLDDEDLEVDGD
jgi:hypothetical protein